MYGIELGQGDQQVRPVLERRSLLEGGSGKILGRQRLDLQLQFNSDPLNRQPLTPITRSAPDLG